MATRRYRSGFPGWFKEARKSEPKWNDLKRDDFREFVRFLGRINLSRAYSASFHAPFTLVSTTVPAANELP